MRAAVNSRAVARGEDLLMAHCSALESEERIPVAARLERLIGADLARLLVVALAGDHRMGWRRLA